jgi:hypothetical protein
MSGQTLGDIVSSMIKPLVPHQTPYDLLQDYLHQLTPSGRMLNNLSEVNDPLVRSLLMEHEIVIRLYLERHNEILPSNAFEANLLTALRQEMTTFQSFLERIQHLSVHELKQLGMSHTMAVNFCSRVYGTRWTTVYTTTRTRSVNHMQVEMSFNDDHVATQQSQRPLSYIEYVATQRECMSIWLLSRLSSTLHIGVWIEMFHIAVVMVNRIQTKRVWPISMLPTRVTVETRTGQLDDGSGNLYIELNRGSIQQS